MKTISKVQAINSRFEFHVCGHVFILHFIPIKALRYYLTKKWVLGI